MSDTDKLYAANEAFFAAELDIIVNKGDLVREGHPLLEGRAALFTEAARRVAYDVEQATAAPGEKRGRGRRSQEPTTPPAPAAITSTSDGGADNGTTSDAVAGTVSRKPETAAKKVEQATAAPGEKPGK